MKTNILVAILVVLIIVLFAVVGTRTRFFGLTGKDKSTLITRGNYPSDWYGTDV